MRPRLILSCSAHTTEGRCNAQGHAATQWCRGDQDPVLLSQTHHSDLSQLSFYFCLSLLSLLPSNPHWPFHCLSNSLVRKEKEADKWKDGTMCVEGVLTLHTRKYAISDYKSQTGRNYIFSLFYAAIIEGTIKVRVGICQASSQSPLIACVHMAAGGSFSSSSEREM